MALTFPLSLPTVDLSSNRFEIGRADLVSPEVSGRIGSVSVGFPLWQARYTFKDVSEEAADEWRAFVSVLRGPQRTFYGRDLTRPLPKKYPNGFAGMTRAGGGAFAGAATSWSVNGTRDGLTVNGLPAGFQLSVGDYGMFRWVTGGQQRRALIRAVEAGTASGAGVLTGLTFEPALPTVVPAGAVFDLLNPVCIMKLLPETDLGEVDALGMISGQVVATQELRA